MNGDSPYITELRRATKREVRDIELPSGGMVRVRSLNGHDLLALNKWKSGGEISMAAFLLAWVDENGLSICPMVTDEDMEALAEWPSADLAAIFSVVQQDMVASHEDVEKKS